VLLSELTVPRPSMARLDLLVRHHEEQPWMTPGLGHRFPSPERDLKASIPAVTAAVGSSTVPSPPVEMVSK